MKAAGKDRIMKFFIILTLLVTGLANCDALPVAKDVDQPECVKIDECSCMLKNVETPGIINLRGSLIVNGSHPAYQTQGKSEQTGLEYDFYYNPCVNFSDYGCPATGICQTGYGASNDLGNLKTVNFVYQDNSVVAIYKSQFDDKYGDNRTSQVELVCDESEELGRFEFVSEPTERHYRFILYTKCACPGMCPPPKVECIAKDLCTCEMSDGSGTINLHSLDNPTSPMRDSPEPLISFLYNPCSPICDGHSVCEERGDLVLYLGLSDSARFIHNNDQLSLQYTAAQDNITSTVNLMCDYGQRDAPFFRVDCNPNIYNVYSVCACPGGCGSPPPPPSCTQTDSCTCKSTSDDAMINLHDLDNPHAPLTAVDNEGYTYYYNPCSGIKLKNEIGKCDGVSACQQDPFHDTYYNIGALNPEIRYNDTVKMFTFRYTGGERGRTFDVKMLCDPDADVPVFATDGYIPKGTLFYPFKLTTKYACM